MRGRAWRWSLSALLGLATASCSGGADGPGSVAMTFSWEQAPVVPVWIWARVEERRGDSPGSGAILASAGPTPWQPGSEGVTLRMRRVANGPDRVAVVEVREGESLSLDVLYYGVSEPFRLAPGSRVVVSVPMVLRSPEPYRSGTAVELLFGPGREAGRTVVSEAEARAATVRTRSWGARRLVLANDPSLSANRTELTLGEAGPATCTREAGPTERGDAWVAWDVCVLPGWDLLAGLPALGDGLYSVFVRFVDHEGYASTPKAARVRLDTQGPVVAAASVSPALAGRDRTVRLEVTLDEPLPDPPAEGARLEVIPPGPASPRFAGPVRVGPSTTYEWSASTGPGGEGDGGTDDGIVYSFAVVLTDRLGNTRERQVLEDDRQRPLGLRIDTQPPTIVTSSVTVSRDRPLAPGEQVVIDLTASEDLPAPPAVRVGGDPAAVAAQQGRSYVYVYLRGDGVADGVKPVDVVIEDAAGNVTRDSDSVPPVTFDSGAPTLVRSTVDPPVANRSSVVRIQAVFDEPVAGTPLLEVSLRHDDGGEERLADRLFGAANVVGPSVVWSRAAQEEELGPLPDGVLVLRVVVADEAGNRSPATGLGELVVDLTLPALDGDVLISHEHARDLTEVSVSLTLVAAGDLDGEPVVFVGGAPMAMDEAASSDDSYRFTYLVDSGRHGGEAPPWGWDEEGAAQVSIALRDLAGNHATVGAGGVVYDFTPPALAGTPRFSRCDERLEAREAENDLWVRAVHPEADCPDPSRRPVEVAFALDEPTSADRLPAVTVAGRPLERLEGEAGDSHFLHGYTPVGDEPQTDSADRGAPGQSVSVTATDRAGNTAVLELGVLRFDESAPSGLTGVGQPLVRLFRAPWGADETDRDSGGLRWGLLGLCPSAVQLSGPGTFSWPETIQSQRADIPPRLGQRAGSGDDRAGRSKWE